MQIVMKPIRVEMSDWKFGFPKNFKPNVHGCEQLSARAMPQVAKRGMVVDPESGCGRPLCLMRPMA